MGVLTEERIKTFLALDIGGNGAGFGDGCSNGDGKGHGFGADLGYPSDKGYGFGHDYCYDNGNGYGYGYSDGISCGNGNGYGDGYGDGNGYDYSGGISEINGHTVYKVDGVNTIITFIWGNVAKGFILEKNTKLVPCCIVKENNKFAHGNTLHKAFTALQEKLYDDSTEEERIEAFKKAFPRYDVQYSNADLFAYHHVLTGSCHMGRESFVNSRGLSLKDKTTVREFVELTKDAYGGDIIKKLPKEYGITD